MRLAGRESGCQYHRRPDTRKDRTLLQVMSVLTDVVRVK